MNTSRALLLVDDNEDDLFFTKNAIEEAKKIAAFEKKRKPLEYGSKDDFQLAQALNELKGLPVQLSKAKVELHKDSDKTSEQNEASPSDPKTGDKKAGTKQ